MIKATRGQKIDTVFVLFIFSVFAVSILIVLMLGASIYHNIAEMSEEGADERLALSYVWTKTKKSNDAGIIYISDFYGSNALMIDETIGDRHFQTIIYYEDGWLMELFAEKGFSLGRTDGSRVIRVSHLEFEAIEYGLIKTTAGDRTLFIYPLSNETLHK